MNKLSRERLEKILKDPNLTPEIVEKLKEIILSIEETEKIVAELKEIKKERAMLQSFANICNREPVYLA